MRNCLRKRWRLEPGGFNVKQRVLRFFAGSGARPPRWVWRSIGGGWAINGSLPRGAPLRGREASGDASGNLGCFGCERNRLTDSHLKDSLAARSGGWHSGRSAGGCGVGFRWYRCAQPPATGWDPSGMKPRRNHGVVVMGTGSWAQGAIKKRGNLPWWAGSGPRKNFVQPRSGIISERRDCHAGSGSL